MKNRANFLALACLLVSTSFLCTGQTAQTPDANQSPATNTALPIRSVEGCLAYTGQTYVLAVVSNGPKQYRVWGGNTGALRTLVGHTVEVSGRAGKSTLLQSIALENPIDATTGVGYDTISADQVRDVVPNCSVPGFEKSITGSGTTPSAP
jgi:hypothetical protein